MKKFMKFIPVALGLLALASCSNDDFLADSPAQQDITADMGKGDMLVIAPELEFGDANDAFTRALRDWEPNKENWKPVYLFTEKDRIRVYDKTLTNYDFYAYSAEQPGNANGGNKKYAFRLMYDEPNIDGNAAYALYPGEDVIRGNWEFNEALNTQEHYMDNHTHGYIKVDIAPEMKYWADYSRIYDPENTTSLYQDRIPTWGAVEEVTDGGYVKTKLEYLTGILVWETTGTPEYAKYMRVQLYDKKNKKFLNIAGRFETDLVKNKIVQLKYKEVDVTDPVTGETKKKKVVDETGTARISYTDEVKADDFSSRDGDYAAKDAIIVDLTGNIGLDPKDAKVAKVFVPLVCTELDNTEVDIIVSTSNDKKNWVEDWRMENQIIKRGKAYYKDAASHMEFNGTTICALNDLLAVIAGETEDDAEVTVTAKNPIEITDECQFLQIPNKNIKLTIDLKKGVYSKSAGKTLTVEYVSKDESNPAPSGVRIIGKPYQNQYAFDLDVQLPRSLFSLVNIPYTKDEAKANSLTEGAVPVKAAAIDAKGFLLGDGKTQVSMKGENLTLSDNVETLAIAKLATLSLTGTDYECGELKVATEAKGLKNVYVNGYLEGGINAKDNEVDITVSGEDQYAVMTGEIRTRGAINVLNRGLILQSECGERGVAAFKKVTVTKQSFIVGPIFSKAGIDIQNEDFNLQNIAYGDGKLSTLIYELYSDDEYAQKIEEQIEAGYGPLYSEDGSVKIAAINSQIKINNNLLEDGELSVFVKSVLNEKAEKAVKFTVYAAEDIDLLGDAITTTAATTEKPGTNMWAENDVNLAGLKNEAGTELAKAKVTSNGKITADNDFVIEGESWAANATVGHNATVTVDPREGNCRAVGTLNFVKNEDADNPGNTLFLNEGYIKKVNNGTDNKAFEVKLKHNTKAAFTAIGEVTTPDKLISQNESKWNGKQMPSKFLTDYQNFTDVWTATQLAAQLQNPVNNETLRTDINLDSQEWSGIEPTKATSYTTYTFHGNDHKISNLKIINHGYINKAYGLDIDNLSLWNVETSIGPKKTFNNLGALAGEVAEGPDASGDAKLSRVTVVLKENSKFGSEDPNNVKIKNVGGVCGLVEGDVDFQGVRVNAQNAVIYGWAHLGGMIGKADGKVKITKAPLEPGKYDAVKQSKVGSLGGFYVTYNRTSEGKYVNDELQGSTGLYLGCTSKRNDVQIDADSDLKEAVTVSGEVDLEVAFTDMAVDEQASKRFYYEEGDQTWIGNCGFFNPDPDASIKLNGGKFAIYKEGQSVVAGSSILYKLISETTHKANH
jgi:hypothetical protein